MKKDILVVFCPFVFFFPLKNVSKLPELFFPLFYGRSFDPDSISKGEDDLY